MEVIPDHSDTKVPHLRYLGRAETVTAATGSTDGTRRRIDLDELGPVARAWLGTSDDVGRERRNDELV